MCTHPYVLYTFGDIRKKTNKKIYSFRRFDYEWLSWYLKLKRKNALGDKFDFFLIPCGHCIECKLQYRKQWSVRLLNELENSKNAFFLTLTYDNDYIPENNSLRKEHIQRFFKSLKEHFSGQKASEIKYFACGEYGGTTLRPHYHAIVFNLPVNDLTELFPDEKGSFIRKCSKSGETLFYSKTLENLWNKGYVNTGAVTFNSCSYVAGYVQKKLYGDDAELYLKNKLLPPFLICSKGIGSKYFLDNKDKIIKTNEIFYLKNNKVCKSGLPRYYKKLLERYFTDDYDDIKIQNRVFTDAVMNTLMSMSDYEQKYYFMNKNERSKIKDARLIRI